MFEELRKSHIHSEQGFNETSIKAVSDLRTSGRVPKNYQLGPKEVEEVDIDKSKLYLKKSLIAFSILMIIVIVIIAILILSFWGSGTWYYYSSAGYIEFESENLTIQNSDENYNLLISDIENEGYVIDWSEYNITEASFSFHLNNLNIKGDYFMCGIAINNSTIKVHYSYHRGDGGYKTNESFQSFLDIDTQMLSVYTDSIKYNIIKVYDVKLLFENIELLEGAIAVD